MPLLAERQLDNPLPILYSFRRCPYAMRARMAISYSGSTVELRDILLRDKPAEMIAASPKATVPVLELPDGEVLDESLDIMLWALERHDPEGWLPEETSARDEIFSLIADNDGPFKMSLDRYKYHVRFPENTREKYREDGEIFLGKLDRKLGRQAYLLSEKITLADMAIFPFIRQFANVDADWFAAAPFPNLRRWLDGILTSQRFREIMIKRPLWTPGSTAEIFPKSDGR
ncbi:glutathione S-transferase [Sneathiella chungangensis]|uniref:Glutathione S-transferase n=1 Tax=Sneathiella chungangensis TaxID=1418234 RepID=A0A845MHR2_9PROT|nr:glutathione S-transferase [Sneathiella chungangensis]MZR23563.1 glutathione S-transferase [Sneathiella chungangensis]